ncbi:unnamed protein product [Rotaria sordida]|uniref:Uncharacterized protein n=1 Tax=Rotaria sordida TaxID=392033 RepID=A0A813Z6H7_9BILA|nr:unnamed protein product [Rotaria sordida]
MFKVSNSNINKSTLKNQLKFLYRLNKALHQDVDESIRLNFNVLGHHYEIPLSILNNYPNTLLGEPKLRVNYYDYLKDEFIFDRHPQAFESIITFYLSDGNSLSKPDWMPTEIFYEELKFFRIKSSILISYYDQEIAPMINIQIIPKNQYKRYLWLLINYSTQDWQSQLMRTIDFIFNLIALGTFTRDCLSNHRMSQIIYWIEESNGQVLRPIYMLFHLHISNMIIELLCTIIFLIELCLRIYLAPTFYQIYSDICFWFEFSSVLSNLFMYIIIEIQKYKKIYFYSCLTCISILRLLRIFRFTRQIIILKIFLYSLIHSIQQLLHLFIILISIILFFGEFTYLIEEWTSDSSIQTVTDGYWLAALTVTSLGYGDLYPTHIYSRILMCICSIIGLVVIAMIVPEIYHYFDRIYQNEMKKRHIIRYIYSDQIALRI